MRIIIESEQEAAPTYPCKKCGDGTRVSIADAADHAARFHPKQKEEALPKKKRGGKNLGGRPEYDPFRKLVAKQGAANTYIKNIPANDWAKFKKVLPRGHGRWAIVRFIQELPGRPDWLRVLEG